jgi:hypothetical protein
MKNKGQHIFNFFWVAFFILIISRSLTYNPKARLIPLLVAAICLVLAIGVFIGEIRKKDKKSGLSGDDALLDGIMKKVDVAAEAGEEKKKVSAEEKKRRFFDAVLWILGFVLMIYLVGFLIAIPLFTFLFMRAKKESWTLSISCSLGLLAGVYLAFVKLSQSTIYEGIIFRLLGD